MKIYKMDISSCLREIEKIFSIVKVEHDKIM